MASQSVQLHRFKPKMSVTVEIDPNSGFCFGVVTAIRKAEEVLDSCGTLYCLGDIVHNSDEVERLRSRGLVTITHAELEKLHDVKVLLRAHGEPPSTYETARRNNIEIIDATCPGCASPPAENQEHIRQLRRQPDCHLRQKRPCRGQRPCRADQRRSDSCRKHR